MTAAEIAVMARVPVESCRIMLWMMMDSMGLVEQCGTLKCGTARPKLWRIAQPKEPERMPIDDLLAMFRRRQCQS